MQTEKKSRLGRGLDALVGTHTEPITLPPTRNEVPVEAIETNPYQPRKTFDGDELASLQKSIESHGILQPLVVRQVGARYQLIAGERRLRAAQAAGMTSVPVSVVDLNDQQSFEAALVENIQRADLNPIEKAQGFKDYLDRYQITHEQLASRLGLGRATITNLVALLELPANLQEAVRVGELTVGHAKALKGIGDPDRQQTVAREIIARGMSVHATEAFVKQMPTEPSENEDRGESTPRSVTVKTAHVQTIEDELRHKFGMKVEIRVKGKEKGQLILRFESNDDFERVVEMLRAA
jgi:ParB family chromosome partitioning protein